MGRTKRKKRGRAEKRKSKINMKEKVKGSTQPLHDVAQGDFKRSKAGLSFYSSGLIPLLVHLSLPYYLPIDV